MKIIFKSKIIQKIMAIILILVMLSSYMPAILLMSIATDEGSGNINDYLDFDINFLSGEKEISGESDTSYGFTYDIKFNGTSTAFKNVTISLKNNDDNPTAKIYSNSLSSVLITNSSSYSRISLGDQSSGVEYNGSGYIMFGKGETQYSKEIIVEVQGTWDNPKTQTTESFLIQKTLKAQITPKKEVIAFDSVIISQRNEYGYEIDASVSSTTTPISDEANVGFFATNVIVRYPIQITSGSLTQKLELNVTINREVEKECKLSDGYTIDWGGLDTVFGTPTERTNDDGSVTYTFVKGADTNEYNKENTFNIDKNFTVVINYKIPNTHALPNAQTYTTCTFTADLVTTGWESEKEFNKEQTVAKKTKQSAYKKTKGCELYSYTPKEDSWDDVSFNTKSSSYINKTQLDTLIENRKLDLDFSTYIHKVKGVKTPVTTGTINYSSPRITYVSDEGNIISRTLSANEYRLKSITQSSSTECKLKIDDNEDITILDKYDFGDNLNINSFGIQIEDHLNKVYGGYVTTYTLDADKLGLTDNELRNIMSISIGMSTSGDRLAGNDVAEYTNEDSIGNTRSYMELMLSKNFDIDSINDITQFQTRALGLRMYKNKDVFRDELKVVNVNPIFYVHLPSGFKYTNYSVSMTSNPNIRILEEQVCPKKIGNETYLVIPCEGTYDSDKNSELDIFVGFDMKTSSANFSTSNEIEAYMITDNEFYTYSTSNKNRLEKLDGTVVEKVFADDAQFTIGTGNIIKATTGIGKSSSEIKIPDKTKNAGVENPIFESPLIVEANQQVIYQSGIEAQQSNLKNITILSRLPIANNTYINSSSEYIVNDTSVSQISMQNLNIDTIKVFSQDSDNIARDINKSNYTIYYSNDETADFTTGTYFEYQDGVTDISNVKNIKVVFNSDYILGSGYKLIFQYEMTMPNEEGVAGAVTGVKYSKGNETNLTELYSEAAYVKQGKAVGNITIYKQFEGYSKGVAPEGIDISGIQFKLKYLDEETGEYKYVKNSSTDEDLIATTNSSGIATLTDVPEGIYYLEEITEFDNYFGISKLTNVVVSAGETTTITALNKLKRGNLTIKKEWQNLEEQIGEAKFRVYGTTKGTTTYNQYVYTDIKTGEVTLKGLPYGDYIIAEEETVNGWTSVEKSIKVTINKDETVQTVVNRLAIGTLKIVKTVPEGETVDGLKFHITGLGMAGKITKSDGEEINTDTDLTVTVGEDYSSNNQISIEKSENDTKATILINNVYLGLFNVEEIDMPTISVNGENIEKYVVARADTELTQDGDTATVGITNRYKFGTLKIQKSAKLKNGDSYIDIGDLSGFKVRVTGTSYYGNNVDTIITLDENGMGSENLQIGEYTITEVPQEGYTTYYGADNTAPTTPPKVIINYNLTTEQSLYNEHTGIGYVRVEKTLEGKSNPQKVIDAGIEFVVVGQNVAGGRVNEKIKINKIDTEKNVAYGVSGPISAGGEYQLEEVEATVPEYFEGSEPIKVEVSTSNTVEAPLILNVENKRTRGNLEITTKTNPEGGTLSGIKYNVIEVEINEDGTYSKIGETQKIDGSNDTVNTGFAELKDIPSGNYLVEQDVIPEGWQKDMAQIVEVPSYNTGYAEFEIIKIKDLPENRLIISKEILNEQMEIATEEDFEKALLNKDESFEVKITNVDTQEEYYTFVTSSETGIIHGLEAGTYEIEEVYKPKYETEGYYLFENNIEYRIEKTNEKNIFTIEENFNNSQTVEIKIKNIINTDFGFGGQTTKDNLSKVDVEKEQDKIVTRTVIYVVDEYNNAISGVKFKLVNSEGKVVNLASSGKEFEINNKKLTIRGLPIGKYTLINTECPDGYLKAEDKEIMVFKDAVQVARVEIQKNIPRGSLTLSTVYKTDNDETKYTSRSKYKIVNKETGELVKFQRTATGDYKKTNLTNASAVISLKSGPVQVEGIETGTYEVGIVDVTAGYGIQSELPEIVSVEQNEEKAVSVEVVDKEIVKVDEGSYISTYLEESGNLYIWGRNDYGVFGNGTEEGNSSSIPTKIVFQGDVKIAKYSENNRSIVAIDTEGRVWSWGYNYNGQLGNGGNSDTYIPTCITEIEPLKYEYYNGGTRFIDVSQQNSTTVLLDNKGRIWTCGNLIGNGTNNDSNIPICISNIGGTPLYEAYNSGIKIKKLAEDSLGAIDTLGRVWAWNYNGYAVFGDDMADLVPVCISEFTEWENVKIENVQIGNYNAMAIDEDGNLWLCGNSSDILYGTIGGTQLLPKKVDSSLFANQKIKDAIISINNSSSSSSYAVAIDENGKLWTWGTSEKGLLGNGAVTSSRIPVCISDDKSESLCNIKIKDISSDDWGDHIIAVDVNNRIWGWGTFYYYSDIINTPRIIPNSYNEHLEYNVRFKEVYNGYDFSYAIDEEGRVWSWGENNQGELGYDTYSNDVLTPTLLEIPGNPKIKKVAPSYQSSNVLILSEEGKVFACGYYTHLGNGLQNGKKTVTEITDNFNLDSESKIIDISIDPRGRAYFAIDSSGKVYTWGSEVMLLGRTTVANPYKIECISDDDDEPLKGIKIVKAPTVYGDIAYAINENGKLYAWGGDSSYDIVQSQIPICITEQSEELSNAYENNIGIVDICEHGFLDNSGKIWSIINNMFTCISDLPETSIYKQYKINPEYKIVKMYKASASTTCDVLVKDNNGDLWYWEYTNQIEKLQGSMDAGRGTVISTKIPKDIISLSHHLLVDSYGQIWVYKNIGNGSGEAGNGTTMPITEPICITDTTKNPLYNVKIKNIINDTLVADEKGNLYEYTSNISKKSGISPVEYIEGTLGIKVVDSKIDFNYSDKTAYHLTVTALDENGKIWEGNNNKVTCISDIEGSELKRKYENDNEFRIVKIITTGSIDYENISKFAIDNYGKVWAWGYNGRKECVANGDNIINPICISEIENTELNNAYKNNASFKIEEIEIPYNGSYTGTIMAKDNNGEIWTWGLSAKELNIEGPYCINNRIDGKTIKDMQLYNKTIVLLCTDGSVYVSDGTSNKSITGTRDWTLVGNCEGATNICSPMYDLWLIYGENKVWSLGYNSSGEAGTGVATSEYVRIPTLISEEISINKAFRYSVGSSYTKINVIDNNGKLWTWGEDHEVVHKPRCEYNTVKAIDKWGEKYDYIINEKGIITSIRTPYYDSYDVSKMIKDIYGDLNEENILKFAKEVENIKNYSGSTIIINNNNLLWQIEYGYGQIPQSCKCISTAIGSEIAGKQIIDYSENKALDSEGNLYVWSANTGLSQTVYAPTCTTNIETYKEAVFKANNTLVNVPIENKLNGVKIKELVNDKFVIDENDDIWYFATEKPINLSKEYLGNKNPLYGKQISEFIGEDYIITTDNEIWYIGSDYPGYIMDAMSIECEYIYKSTSFYVALDKNGKIWTCGQNKYGGLGNGQVKGNITKPVCISDIEGTELCNAYKNNSDFRIEKIYNNSYESFIALDNNGKLWTWGYNYKNVLGNGTETNTITATPVCISDIEGTELYNEHINDSNFKIEEIRFTWSDVMAIDSNGKLWAWGNAWIGNGSGEGSSVPQCISDITSGALYTAKNNDPNFRINKVKTLQGRQCAIGNNGKVYINSQYPDGNYRCVSETMTGIIDIYETKDVYYGSTGYGYEYLAYGNNAVYTFETRLINNNLSITTRKIATCNIKQAIQTHDSVVALDDEGKVWFFGETNYAPIGIETTSETYYGCISDISTCELYGKNIENIQYINGSIFATDTDGNLYAWGSGIATKKVSLFNQYDMYIKEIFNEDANNENRIKFAEMLTSLNGGYSVIYKQGDEYIETTFSITNDEVKVKEVKRINKTAQYIGGLGIIEKVLDTSHIQTADGKIWEISETGETTIDDDYVPSENEDTEEIQPIEIEGVNIIQQTQHKALDDQGNLYVWEENTGFISQIEGIICTTTTQYDVEPIYSHTNGWSVIKNQF